MTDQIRDEVIKFICSEKNDVLVLKGDWGVGKTYFWKQWVRQNKNNISKSRYAYVSLFGINSLDDLKNQIHVSAKPSCFIDIEPLYQVVISWLSWGKLRTLPKGAFGYFKKCCSIAKREPLISLYNALRKIGKLLIYLFFNAIWLIGIVLKFIPNLIRFIDMKAIGWESVRNTLICIDDFERHGKGLAAKDIFGVISVLKEQRNCKVVLILNDNELNREDNKEDKEAYISYREKVVDIELNLTRHIDELISLVFDEWRYTPISNLSVNISKLEIMNIRTLYKVRNYLELIFTKYPDIEESVKEKIVRNIVLFTALYFSKSNEKKWPDLDVLMSKNTQVVSMIPYDIKKEYTDDDGKKQQAENLRIYSIMQAYEWRGPDPLDEQLAKLVINGYLDQDNFQSALDDYINNQESYLAKDNYHKLDMMVGDVLWNSFDDNSEKIETAMKATIEAALNLHVPLGKLSQYVGILNDIEEPQKAEELIDWYIDLVNERNKEAQSYFNPENIEMGLYGTANDYLSDKIVPLYEAAKTQNLEKILSDESDEKEQTLKEIISRCPDYRLIEGDYDLLSRCSENDFKSFLKATGMTKEVGSFLNIFLSDNSVFGSRQAEHEAIKEKLIPVVNSLAEESVLNKWRLRYQLNLIKQNTKASDQ